MMKSYMPKIKENKLQLLIYETSESKAPASVVLCACPSESDFYFPACTLLCTFKSSYQKCVFLLQSITI